MTEVKRGLGRPKKTDVTVTKRKRAPYGLTVNVEKTHLIDWKDMAYKVQGALESAIKEIKELEQRVSLLHTQNVELTGVIRYLEIKVKDANSINPV